MTPPRDREHAAGLGRKPLPEYAFAHRQRDTLAVAAALALWTGCLNGSRFGEPTAHERENDPPETHPASGSAFSTPLA